MSFVENAQVWMGGKLASLKGGEYKEAFNIMKKWNDLKNDMYEGRLITEFGMSGGSDNLCRVGAGIEIGQRAAKLRAEGKVKEADELIASCLELSSYREKADTVRKKLSGGSNKDADKDEENIRKGIAIGLKYPKADKWKILSHMDMETGEFKKGYNNGYADFIKKNYKLGEKNTPKFSKDEGRLIASLVKSGACKDLGEALAFMDKYKDKASEMVRRAFILSSASRVPYSVKDSLAHVAKFEDQKQQEIVARSAMRKERQLADAKIKKSKSLGKSQKDQVKQKTSSRQIAHSHKPEQMQTPSVSTMVFGKEAHGA